jgi:hypothetical protein
MRGFPLVNFLVALAAMIALAAPLLSLSRDRPTAAAVEAVIVPPGTVATKVMVNLVHPATEASVWVDAKQVHAWVLSQPNTSLEATLPLPLVESSMEFEVRLTWTTGTPKTAAEIRVEPEGLDGQSQNVWGTGHAEEVLTYSWK